jgi:hypothetical protein
MGKVHGTEERSRRLQETPQDEMESSPRAVCLVMLVVCSVFVLSSAAFAKDMRFWNRGKQHGITVFVSLFYFPIQSVAFEGMVAKDRF